MSQTARSFDGPGVDETEDVTTPAPAAKTTVHAASPLDALRAEVQRELESEPVTYPVPGRPGWAARFNTNVSGDQLKAWGRKCTTRRGGKEDFDPLKLSKIVIANQCEALVLDGEDVWADGDEDDLINLTHPAFMEMIGVSSGLDAVKAWYQSDGVIMQLGQQLLEDAGYTDTRIEDVEEDPTQRS